MKVRDLMTEEVITLNAASPLVSAEEIMGLKRVRHLPCVEEGRFVGLITHRDLLRAYLPTGTVVERAIYASKTKVRDYMHTDVITVTADTSAKDALRLLRKHKYGCMPVVDATGSLVGIITDADFLLLAEIVLGMIEADGPARVAELARAIDAAQA